MFQKPRIKIILIITLLLVIPSLVGADTLGQTQNFFVDPSYDLTGREKISATLQKVGERAYFYVDDEYRQKLTDVEKEKIEQAIQNLDLEFSNKIYPTLTANYGFEWRPGIDKDEKITILFHQLKEEAGGYFNSGDEYPKIQNPRSNEREMVYLNTNYINSSSIKSFLAHEFTHLIIFNQKEKIRYVEEEIWLNEARAEASPTLLGYDENSTATNLQNRIKNFLRNPSDSLTEWKNLPSDYGALNLFVQYLVDHYGIEVLAESLRSDKIGISSINSALKKQGFNTDFSQIFTEWTIAVLVNNCNLGEIYCYKNKELQDFRINPLTNFLPLIGKSSLKYGNSTQNWTGNWLKIIGGRGNLKLEFDGSDEVKFKVPYILEDIKGNVSVKYLELNSGQKGTIFIPEFGSAFSSLTIVPSIQTKTSGFGSSESYFAFFWQATTQGEEEVAEEKLREDLLKKIIELQSQIVKLLAQINEILSKKIPTGFKFEKNLSLGMKNQNVIYLKIVLTKEGCFSDLINEQLFDSEMLEGVKCFQKKYQAEISQFAGYQISASGFVGSGTRAKLNQLISF